MTFLHSLIINVTSTMVASAIAVVFGLTNRRLVGIRNATRIIVMAILKTYWRFLLFALEIVSTRSVGGLPWNRFERFNVEALVFESSA